MPTARPRYQVTETNEVARALDAAAQRWPGEPRSRLVVRLIVDNGGAVGEVNEEESARRLLLAARRDGASLATFDQGLAQTARDEGIPVLGINQLG